MKMRRKFTFVELLLTLAAISLLATVAVPSVTSTINALQNRGVQDRILYNISRIRSSALETDSEYTVTLSSSGYLIEGPLIRGKMRANLFPKNIRLIRTSINPIVFDGNGHATPARLFFKNEEFGTHFIVDIDLTQTVTGR